MKAEEGKVKTSHTVAELFCGVQVLICVPDSRPLLPGLRICAVNQVYASSQNLDNSIDVNIT